MRSRIISACCALIGIGILRTLTNPAPWLTNGLSGNALSDGGTVVRVLGRVGLALGQMSDNAWRFDFLCLMTVAALAFLVLRPRLNKQRRAAQV